MSSTHFLIQLRQLLSEKDCQILTSSLRQDNLVWSSLQDKTFCDSALTFAGKDLLLWQPYQLALLAQGLASIKDDLTSAPFNPLEPDIRQQSIQAYEKTLALGEAPVNLAEAGWLALALRERLRLTNSWQGLAIELSGQRTDSPARISNEVWRTPLTCLFGLVPDPKDLLKALFPKTSHENRIDQIKLILHILLSNPMPEEKQIETLVDLLSNSPCAHQIEWLNCIEGTGRSMLCQSLAKTLLCSEQNTARFSQLSVPVSTIQKPGENRTMAAGIPIKGDPLETSESTHKIELMQQFATFLHFAGADAQALPVLTRARQATQRLQALLTSQLAENNQDPITAWEQVVELAPESPLARSRLAIALAEADRQQDALAILPESLDHSAILMAKTKVATRMGDLVQAQSYAHKMAQLIFSKPSQEGSPPASSNGFYFPVIETIQTLLDLNLTEDAIRIGQSALDNRTTDADLAGLIARAQIQTCRSSEAVESAYLASILAPENLKIHRLLAEALEAAYQLDQAYLERQYIVDHSSPVRNPDLLALAGCALKTNHLDITLLICEKALANNPDEGLAHSLSGEALMKSGKIEDAIGHFYQATLLTPEMDYPWLALSQAQASAGDPQQALVTLRSAAKANPQSIDILLELGKACLFNNCPAEALAPLRTAYGINPQNVEISYRYAESLYQLGHFKEARQILNAARQEWPADARLAFLRGQTLLNLDEKHAALPDLLFGAQAASEGIEPSILLAHTVLDLINTQPAKPHMVNQGDQQEGFDLSHVITVLKNALSGDPTHIEGQTLLAEVLKANANYPDALEVYRHLTETGIDRNSPWHWRVHFGLGQVALAQGMVEAALASLQEAAAARPENLATQQILAEALCKANLSDEAIQTARFAIRMAPHDVDNLTWFATLAQSLDYQSDVINVLERAIQIDPERSDLLLWISQTYLASGNLAAAQQTLRRLLSLPGASADQLHQAAFTFIHMEDYTSAAAMLEAARLKSTPNTYHLLFDLALVYQQIGNIAGALDVLQQAKSLKADDPRLWSTQADLLSRLDRPQAALASLEHCLQLAADSAQANSSTGLSYLVQKIDANSAIIHAHLAHLMRSLGDLQGALEHAEEAVVLNPEDPELRFLAVDLAYSLVELDRAKAWLDGEWLENLLNRTEPVSHPPAVTSLLVAQAGLALEQENVDLAGQAVLKAAQISPNLTHIAAAQARLAIRTGERLAASQFLAQALLALKQSQTAVIQASNQTAPMFKDSREMWAILAVADAAVELDQWASAFSLYQQAISFYPMEPRPQLRYARALVICTENQITLKALKVSTHSFNGPESLEQRYSEFQQAITSANQRCSSSEITHWRDRGEAIFNPNLQTARSLNRRLSDSKDIAALVTVFGRINRVAEAIKIGEAYPDKSEVQVQLAIALMETDPELSLAAAKRAVDHNPIDPCNHALIAFLSMGDLPAAQQAIEIALSFWPDEPDWQEFAAQLCVQMDQWPAAIKHWQQLNSLKPNFGPYLAALGNAFLENNEISLAVQTLEKASRVDPMKAETWLALAKAYIQAGDFAHALDCADRGVDLDENSIPALLLSGKIAQQLHKVDLPLQRGKAVLKLDPASTDGILLYTRALYQTNHAEEALTAIEKALPETNQAFPVLVERAQLVQKVRGSQAALPYLTQLANSNPDRPEVLAPLAEALADTGQYQASESTALAALKFDPDQAPLYLLLGRLQRMKGQLDQAISYLSDAIRLEPDLIESYIELGRSYQDRREHLQAIRIYKQAIQVAPDDPRAYYQAALVLRENKDYTSAEAMLREAVKLAPDEVGIRRQLGAIIALNLVHHSQEASYPS